MKKALILILLVLLGTVRIYATEMRSGDKAINEYLDLMDMQPIENELKESAYGSTESFRETVEKAIKGELDLSPLGIVNSAARIFFNELYENATLMRNLLVVAILSSVLKNLTESFKNKDVGQMGFFVSYIILISILINSFSVTAGIMQDLINTLLQLMQAALPLMLSLLVMSGSVAGAYAFSPLIFFITEIAASVIGGILVPVIMLAAGVQITNYLTEREILGKFSDLIKKFCEWSLKGIIFLFVSVLSLQRVSTPILNNVALKTARSAAGSVPVVGDILTGAMDSVLAFSSAAKSGVAVAVVIVIITACAVPIIKLVALIIVYKLVAAVIEPVSDERIVECIDSIGSFSFLMLVAGITVIVLFVFTVMILLSF